MFVEQAYVVALVLESYALADNIEIVSPPMLAGRHFFMSELLGWLALKNSSEIGNI